MDVSVTR